MGEHDRTAPGRARRTSIAAAVVAAVILVAGCELTFQGNLNTARTTASVPTLPVSGSLTVAARAHSTEMCTTGSVTPAADIVATYLGEPTTRIDELVGAAALDPGISDGGQRNVQATNDIWAQWTGEPTLVDPKWDVMGVGEHTCPDGKLYATLLLRDDPPALSTPADTSAIQYVESVTEDGWTFDRYRNLAYPCAISGYQSFVIGTKVGSSPTATRPLWVKMRGGGAGWFDTDGTPLPTAGVKSEESMTTQLNYDTNGLMADVKASTEGFRVLIVSMCSHDIYAGNDTYDPYNSNLTAGGETRPTTGLTATKSAIQFAHATYPTDDYFLHGTSAGGYGTIHVAWAMQQQGTPPTGIVSDSGVLNQAWQRYVAENGISGSPGCEKATEQRGYGVLGRIDRAIGDPANEPHLLVATGALTVPMVHIWNHADNNVCGDIPIPCPLPDGSNPIMAAADCVHEPLRLAVEAHGAVNSSINMGVCVEGGDPIVPCDRHVVTSVNNGVNTDPDLPADYQAVILDWVLDRLDDD